MTIIQDGTPGLTGKTRVVVDHGTPAVAQAFTPSTQQSGALHITNGDDATVVMNLPSIGVVGVGYSVTIRTTNLDFATTVARNGADTINGGAGPTTITPINTEFTFTAISATNWGVSS